MTFDFNKFIDALKSTLDECACNDNNKKGTTVYFNSSVSDASDKEKLSEEIEKAKNEIRKQLGENKFHDFDKAVTSASEIIGNFIKGLADGFSDNCKKETDKEQECDCKNCNCKKEAEKDIIVKHVKKSSKPIFTNKINEFNILQKNKKDWNVKTNKQSIAERLRSELSKQPTSDEVIADYMVEVVVKKLQTPGAYMLHPKTDVAEACAEVKIKYSEFQTKFKGITLDKLTQDSFIISTFKEKLIAATGANDIYFSMTDSNFITMYITI